MRKLWLLEPRPELLTSESNKANPWEPWFDKTFGFVVRAETEEEARILAAKGAGDEKDEQPVNPWLEPRFSTCIELTGDGEPGIVIRDFAQA